MSTDQTLKSIADVLAANELHIVPRDPNRPEPHWHDIPALPELRPVPTTEDRMRDARTDRSFATYLDATERDQLDARAAAAEAERDEALDARDVLRQQLDTARADTHRDIARQIDILAADPGILRDWLTTCDPQPTGFGELFHALAEKLRRPSPPSSVPPRRAQEDQQAARDRVKHAIRARLGAVWPPLDDLAQNNWLDQVAAVAAVAAVDTLREG